MRQMFWRGRCVWRGFHRLSQNFGRGVKRRVAHDGSSVRVRCGWGIPRGEGVTVYKSFPGHLVRGLHALVTPRLGRLDNNFQGARGCVA